MSKKRMKTRLGADGIDYPYTSESLVFDNKGRSIDQKYATKEDLESLSMVDELEERVSANEESIAWLLENGGGGGGTISCYISTTDAENFIISTGNDLTLHLDFFSPNIGKGTLKVFINDVESKSVTIAQGDTATIIEGDLFNTGSNTMRVYVVDRTGNLTNELTFYVRYGSTQITSTFDPYISYDFGSIIRYYFTVTALDTSDTLTFYIKIDDELQNPINCKSEVRAYFTFPSTLSVGSHYCEAWAEDSVGKSNILKFNIIILDDRAVVVASDTQTLSVEEGSQVSLDYKVYMKNNTTFITKIYIDNEYSSSGTCGLETSFYKTSNLKEGIHTIKLEVWDTTETVSDYVTWTVTITPSTYEMVTATTAGASAIFTAMNRLNSDENREIWIGTNQDGGQIVANLSNFAFNSESGWVDDNLIMSGNSAVEIPITPLANNAKYGFTLDIEFTSKAIGVEDALVLKLWNDTDDCGIKITTEELILRSKENNECRLYFTDNENTSVMFIIDRDEGFAKIYLNGVMCEAFHLNDYTVNGVAYLEDFTVNDTIKLGGSGYCQIKNLRVYEIALATNEILNNFISNETNKEAQRMLVDFQKGDNLPTLTIYGDFSGLGKDDKKPCDIVYLSTDVTKYGESFTLSGKTSSLQYQGTSSMAYPIKNYRINLRDSLGNKWKYNPFNGGQPESRFCLKADFITSNHAHNTGMAKFISDKLYNYDVSNESTMNPAKWWSINNGGKLTDTRETINGFPCRLILVNDGDTALNEGQAEPTPGNTKDMGIFNFNNDKDNLNTMGMDTDVFPNAMSFEVTANSDTSAGAFVPYEALYYSGYWTDSGRKHTVIFPVANFSENNQITVSVSDNSEFYVAFYGKTNWISSTSFMPSGNVVDIKDGCTNISIAIKTSSNAEYIAINDSKISFTDEVIQKDTYGILTQDMTELSYLQQSFELRYPDSDDVGSDYGYLGMNVNTYHFRTATLSGAKATSNIPVSFFNADELILEDTDFAIGGYRFINIYVDDVLTQIDGLPYTIDVSSAEKIKFQPYGDTNWTYLQLNGVKYFADNIHNSYDTNSYEPHTEEQFSTDYGLKRVIDWVGNCTDEEFKADFDKYFNRHYTLRYYLLVVLMAGVDNLGKNLMLDSWDGQIWYPRFYDIDTILSYDNSGEIKFDVDIEMEQGYWNTSASRLWTKIRDNFHDELVEVYKQMRGNGVTYEQIMHYMYDEQIGKIPQTYYNKDFDIKYAPYADQYIGKAHGDGYEHMKRWLKRRFIFCDTLFDYAPSYENDVLTIRANTLEEMNLTIDTYTPLYQHVSFYNGNMEKIKITPGQPVTFKGFAQTATDQEVLIYGGNNIKKITGISTCNPNSMLIGFAPRLTELDISNCPILTIVNSNKANFSPHTYLNKLNISNCPQLGGNLNVSNSPLLQEIKARNSAVTGLLLPTSLRNLKTLELPNTISSLALYDAGVLENLKFDEGVAMQSIELSNCPGITNTENFDLTQTPTVILDNSYDTEELYMSATTNLTLRNMSNLERVIYTPNAEYSEFDINNVINGKNYKITTNSCPKLTTFMTTAPHRDSYNGEDVEYREEVVSIPNYDNLLNIMPNEDPKNAMVNDTTGAVTDSTSGIHFTTQDYIQVIGDINYTLRITNGSSSAALNGAFYDSSMTFIDGFYEDSWTEYTFTTPTNCRYIRFHVHGSSSLFKSIELLSPTINNTTIQVKDYGDITPNTSFTANTLDLSATQFTDIKLLCTTDIYNLKVPTTMKNFYCDSAMDIDTDVIEDASYEVIHGELIEPYTTNYEGEVTLKEEGFFENVVITEWNENTNIHNTSGNLQTNNSYKTSNLIEVKGGTYITHVTSAIDVYQYTEEMKLCYYSGSSRTLQANTKYIRVVAPMSTTDVKISYTGVNYRTPNIIPSSANGSLIFNMYSNNTTQPTSISPYMWDLTGLKLNDFHTYGMNNWVKKYWKDYNPTPLPFASYVHPQGSVGEKIKFVAGLDANSTKPLQYSMHCLQVKPGEIYALNKDIDGYYYSAEYWGTTLDGTLTLVKTSVSNNVKITVPDNTELFWIAFFYHTNKDYINKEWNYIIGNGKYWWANPSVDYTLHWDDIQTMTYEQVRDTLAIDPATVGNAFGDGTMPPYNITMPQRMPGYSVRLVNADITPDEYPTMLYPKWIDTGLPITGKLDYTKYNGTSLAWAYAYTTGDVDISPLGSQHQGNITQDYNKLYGTDFVDIVDVWVYKDTDVSKLSTNEAITKAYIELTRNNYETRIDDVLKYYPNCTDVYLFDDGNVVNLQYMYSNGGHNNANKTRQQIQNITFMEGYFEKLEGLMNAFTSCENLVTVNNIPKSVKDFRNCFESCKKLDCQFDFSDYNVGTESMKNTFIYCSSLTQAPILPQGITSMQGTFQGCTSLTTAPTIPNSVTNMQDTFKDCTSLTTVPNIPSSCVNFGSTFARCSSLVTLPSDGYKGNMSTTFELCTKLNCQINIESANNLQYTFQGCSALTIPPSLPETASCTMQQCFRNCTSLSTAPTIPQGVTTMASTFQNCTSLTTAPTIPQGVTSVVECFRNCTSLTTPPILSDNIQDIRGFVRQCSSLKEVVIPLSNTSMYTDAITDCHGLENITWVGERTYDLVVYGETSFALGSNQGGVVLLGEEDIKELVPEHLDDLYKDEIKISFSNKKITINNTETTWEEE